MTIIDNYKFKDLTQIGSPKDEYGLSKGLEEAAFNIPGGPDKINFYAQSQTDTDRQAMVDVLTIYKKERARLKRINDAKSDLRNLLRKQNRKINTGPDKEDDLVTAIDKELKDNPVTQELKVEKTKTGGQTGGDLKTMIEKTWGEQKTPEQETAFVEKLDDDPLYSPKNAEIGSIDRVIFIVGTYIIRMIILFMIEWGINSGMIKTFQQCFTTYIVGYIALFFVWVLLVNIRENNYEENVLLSTIFYYLNTRAHKSTKYRIGLHIFVQISLVPVLFIVSRRGSEIDLDSFEQRRAIYNAISQFTFFTWLMTTIIATRF